MWIIIALILAALIVFEYGWGALLIYIALFVLGCVLMYAVKKESPEKNHTPTTSSFGGSSSDDDSFSTDDIIEIEMMEDFKDDLFD